MGLFKSLRGKQPEYIGNDSSSDATHHTQQDYQPPPGAPPSKPQQSGYAPPPGPPPSYQGSEYAPPTGPPPSADVASSSKPPAYHDWTAIPDTALLPPPPSLANKFSPTGNAEESEAIRAHQWCARYPLMQPHEPTAVQVQGVRQGQVSLQQPKEFKGTVSEASTGLFRCSTKPANKDSCLISALPLYFVMAESPFRTEVPKTVYFEVKILSFGRSPTGESSSLAIGLCGVPYPTWRMPGWERGSMAVHSDDGRRYINDTDGGIDFVAPFQAGETIGFGVTFSIPDPLPGYAPAPVQGSSLKGDVFLTRNGKQCGNWNIHEERDAESEFGILGLDGRYDLFGAVGTFGEVTFDVLFNSRDWLWQPR